MAQFSSAVKTIEELQISPPLGTVTATSTPLNFLDIPWFVCHPTQRVFFYNIPAVSNHHFRESIIPNLTSSLSIALRYFYPFAARFISLPWPNYPYILYSDGDSVPFTVAESTALDFSQVTSDQPTDVRLLHPLLPKLLPPVTNSDGATVSNLLSVKVTLFPNSGICIGIEFRHVAADGVAFNHFLKSWASISKSGCKDLSWVEKNLPVLDRGLIKDPKNYRKLFLDQIWKFAAPWDENSVHDKLLDKVRATFVIGGEDISRLKKLANGSAFVVASAFVWTNLTKSLAEEEDDDDKIDSYVFPADCRGRIEPKVPTTYFGNCLGGVLVSLRRRDLVGDGGFAAAAVEIAAKIEEMEREGALKDAENWFTKYDKNLKRGRTVSVAGSPKLRVYETDFGWGRPRKSEPVHVDFSGSIYFSDVRDVERGGIEFGLALGRAEMDSFVGVFESRLNQLSA
ncbi:Coumaroyl-CoA:anthocyanidin 3-O-glucoside-6''-O-coumaroyltransferase 1 [Linum grandiflorum]